MKDFAFEYHKILCDCPPQFIFEYSTLPLLQRLKGVGLLCGTDWTSLYKNKFYYSRYEHSLGCALIVWNFTHDKKQTIAALLHDVSTQSFSHVNDFRFGDALTQTVSEKDNKKIIAENEELNKLLCRDKIKVEEVFDYHIYPVADNKLPGLSADRLEYMYPSGAALSGEWKLLDIKKNYSKICLLKNEKGILELGFDDIKAAELYTKKFCAISLILQHNENKLALQMMADIIKRAMELNFLSEEDLFKFSEEELIKLFTEVSEKNIDSWFTKIFSAFRNMKKIKRSKKALDGYYNVCLETKKRYVNPLVKSRDGSVFRIADVSPCAKNAIDSFLKFEDTKYGCVKI